MPKKEKNLEVNIKRVPKKEEPTKDSVLGIDSRVTALETHAGGTIERLDICNTNIQAAWDKIEDMQAKLDRVAVRLGL